ncbi:MAG: hypothetical protein V3V14_03750 [Saprospiraceae bacterium]
MKRKLQIPLMMLVFVMCSSGLMAQKVLHKANKQFRLKHYHDAIDSYTKTLDSHPTNLEAKSKLAESYRMTNQLAKAADVYASIMPEEYVDPIYIRNYGLTLMKMAKYNDAHYQFELYKIYDAQDAQHYQLSCEFAHHLYKRKQEYDIELVGVNTSNSDFGVTFFNDRMIFSSFRNDIGLSEEIAKNDRISLSGNMLYLAELDTDLRAKDVRFLRSSIAEKKNIGPISFASNAKICAFTRNNIKNGGAHVTGDDSSHSIYIAELKENGDWYNERPFRYNEFGTSTGFPSLAFDGSALYFSSNRVGGYGGYDIYVSYYKQGQWTYPENLGDAINTKGNEITPFFTGENLYFSSDYHHGMGGYDIFHSEVVGGLWSHPLNMANGINSPADDYYPSLRQDSKGIFFSSNRLGGKGMDDVYLAMPSNADQELANIDVMPEAVVLTTMLSEAKDEISTNPIAKVVSNDEEIKVTVINPDVNDRPIAKDNTPNENLPTWGFAGVPAPKVQAPRALLSWERIGTKYSSWVDNNSTAVLLPIISINANSSSEVLGAYVVLLDTEVQEKIILLEETETIEIAEQHSVEKEIIVAEVILDSPKLDKVDSENGLEQEKLEIETATLEESTIVAKQETAIDTKAVLTESVEETIKNDVPTIITEGNNNPVVTNEVSIPIVEKENIEVEKTILKEVVSVPPTSYKIPNYAAISANRAPLNLNLSGAKRVALGEKLPAADVYFIQLAALTKTSGNVSHFKKLAKYGNLYKVFKSASTKIKLGYFLDRSEASNVLKSVKAKGFKDAFITKDDLGLLQLELIIANEKQEASYQSYTDNYNTKSTTNTYNNSDFSLNNPGKDSYKIRLASYEDPIWFDIDGAKSLGKIEQWTKGSWTIFILGGYGTFDEAEQARIRAVNKGFADAEIVIDNNGILVRLRQN